jgi:hypothetical protein
VEAWRRAGADRVVNSLEEVIVADVLALLRKA